jgi:hypothetical protein
MNVKAVPTSQEGFLPEGPGTTEETWEWTLSFQGGL